MRLLLDQDIYKTTTDQLRLWGHDVVTAREIGMHRAGDEDLLKKARESSHLCLPR
jgi:predicted nuclease of predicted toxin-antitoxin system